LTVKQKILIISYVIPLSIIDSANQILIEYQLINNQFTIQS